MATHDPNFPPVTEDDIAHFLSTTPDFFTRHAELLAAVQLTSPHGNRAISLQERQAEMLREKIKALEQRIMEMVRNGNDNMVIANRLQNWTRNVLLVHESTALPAAIADSIAHDFMVPQVAVRLWGLAGAFADEAFALGASEDVQIFAASLSQPYCGVNTGFEADSWLKDAAHAQSIALIPLRAGPGSDVFGLLVLASPDAQRFQAGMGTDFLERIGELAGAALSRLR